MDSIQKIVLAANNVLYPTREKRVFHFSGGRTSAYMVLHFWQPGDLVIFCDTTREDPDTYRFIADFEKHTGIPVIKLTGNWRKEVIQAEKMIPNRFKRKCTINLKIKKARRYLRSIGWFRYTQFIGFRHDEQTRIDGYTTQWQAVKTVFLLDEHFITKPQIIKYFSQYSWDLQIESIEGNCDLCFQKGKAAVIALIKNKPSRADKWIEDEEDKILNPKGYTYFTGVTFRQLRDAALLLNKEYDLKDIVPEFNCSCTA